MSFLALMCASTGSTTMGRSVFLIVTGHLFAGFASMADWFDLCTSARECVETFASTCDCVELLSSKGDCVCFDRQFCDCKGRLKIPTDKSGTLYLSLYLEYLILKCIEVHPVSFD